MNLYYFDNKMYRTLKYKIYKYIVIIATIIYYNILINIITIIYYIYYYNKYIIL